MLTVKQIDAAKPKDKPYRILDGDGLYLYVPVSGKKVWQFRYQVGGKYNVITLGKLADVSLKDARELAIDVRRNLSSGNSPTGKDEKSNPDTFKNIFYEWYKHKLVTWSKGYAAELLRMFEDDILPMIGSIDIKEIDAMTLLGVIRLFEDRGAMERANKARRRCGEVIGYAIITCRAKHNPAPDLANAMKGYRKKNFPFLPADQIPAFNRALSTYSGSVVSLSATRFLQYTALRTVEMRSIKWSDINFDERVITIQPETMKSRKMHLVPMSDQVIELLKKLKPITEISDYVFMGRNSVEKPISENAVLLVIRQIGYEGLASGHGFRHTFSTVLNEYGWPADAVERQLAHTERDVVRGVYNHAQYLDKRREMMQWWADWVDGQI